jgi:Mg-chelatase subunit ChlD/uncharacterized membrane protein
MTFDRPLLLAALAAVPLALLAAALTRQEAPAARRVLSALLRAATLALLALGAAGPCLERASGRAPVAFVLDVSPSVRGAGLDRVQALARGLRPGDEAALVTFAAEARVALPLGAPSRILAWTAPRTTEEGSDLASALRLAEATLARSGSPAEGRIVLVSDGRATRGSARDEAARLRSRGIEVDTVAIPGEAPLDARVVRVDLGAGEAREGEGLIVRVELAATRPCSGEIVLSRDGESRPAWRRPVELSTPGERGDGASAPEWTTTVVFKDRADRRGVHRYEARVFVPGDVEPENDARGAALLVKGGPRAIVIELGATDGEAAVRVLTAQGMSVKRVSPENAPDASELDAVDLVVLASGELAPDKARALEEFVHAGGGLLALGGARSYSGWRGTPIEEALPVTAEPRPAERPQVALVIAIDKSGSMRGPKLELAKLAARNAVWGLGKDDMLGVIAFNYNAYWIVPLERIQDKARVQQAIEMQAAGGGTDLMPSLREAKATLLPSNARVKHFLVLTDGIAGDGDAVCAYAGDLARSGITTSTVAVGEDADQDLLMRISMAGKGHHHNAARVSELPRIVLEEALVCARLAMEEEPFRIRRVRGHEILAGVDLDTAPALHGIDSTKAKPLASVLLEGPRGLPLLAVWEHGLGRAAAWTSDLSPRWSEELLRHESFPKLLSQLARHLLRREGARGIDVELAARETPSGVALRAEARHEDGRFASDLALEARIRSAEGGASVPLALTAPGRYEGTATVGSGSFLVECRLGQLVLATAGFARGASVEHERVGADRDALLAIARAGGGALDPETIQAPDRRAPRREPLASLFFAVAAVLVPLEVATRRLRLG